MSEVNWEDSSADSPNNLTQLEAQQRHKLVALNTVHYTLHLVLPPGSKDYTGHITIRFDLVKKPAAKGELFLDFVGKVITKFTANGEAVTENPFKGNRIELHDVAKEGSNEIVLSYTSAYNTDGAGFHCFTDPEDGEVYVYSNFEPFDAHRMFPCFDQPDIKATFSLTVSAPAVWTVLSNYPEEKSSVDEAGLAVHHFALTPRFSTYLYALVAGPYDEFRSTYDNDRIPLGIYCRKSMSKFLDKEVLFTQTHQGLGFYEDFFGTPYPFAKYDQIWVPEFNAGAMENVGCVTFWEGYIFKDTPTKAQLANRCDTVLHEMAHMWFGNLVSPVWWDGLWLNESFATYMAAVCTCNATEFGSLSWQNFNSSMKTWAYREDQLSTTHPIQGTVIDTDATFLTFDGITYGKGASLLKQLVYVIGEESFKAGMHYYFQKYAWGNTTITDFLEALEHCSKGTLNASSWSSEWLSTAGLNTLQLEFTTDESTQTISNCVIKQSAPADYPTLRNHHLEIVLYDLSEDGKLTKREAKNFVVLPQSSTDVGYLVGSKVPSFAYINNGDYAFAKCFLDPKSQDFSVLHMSKFDDALLRQVLWAAFYDLTRDASMPVFKFLKLVSTHIVHETDLKLISTVIDRASASSHNFVPDALRFQELDVLFEMAYSRYQDPSITPEQKIVWERAVVTFCQSKQAVEKIVTLLNDPEVKLAQTRRWQIITKTFAWNLPEAQALLDKEKEADRSDAGVRAALTCVSSVPDAAVKKEAWERFLKKESDLSGHQRDADMSGFRWFHQRDLIDEYKSKFFEVIREVFQTREKEFAASFAGNLFPYEPEDDTVLQRTKDLLATLTPEEQHLTHTLKELVDDLERARKCRRLAQASLVQ